MRTNLRSTHLWITVLTFFMFQAACGGGGNGTDDVGGGESTETDITTPDVAPDVPDTGPIEINPDDFKILYTYQERFESCDNDPETDPLIRESDLHIIWPDGTHKTTVTSLSLKSEGRTCEFGCFTDRNMSWIAIADSVNSTGTFDFVLGKFDHLLEAKVIKGFELEEVVDFEFGGGYFFITKLAGQDVSGPGGRFYSLTRVELANTDVQPLLPAFPAEQDRPNSTYQGHFSADVSGEHLVLLNPTIGSQQVFHWSQQSLLEELDKICPNEFEGVCATSGSQYSDTDAVAIDPNGETVIGVFQNDDSLGIYKYDLIHHQKYFNNLLAVPAGTTFEASACFNTTETFSWVTVRQAQMSPDGSEVLLLVANDCPSKLKEETDIIAIPIDAIGDGTPLDASDIRNITNNPKGERVDNIIIDRFDLSPDGNVIVFSGSPMYDVDNISILGNTDLRTKQDRELYVMTVDGLITEQLTNDMCYKALGPLAVTPQGTPPDWE